MDRLHPDRKGVCAIHQGSIEVISETYLEIDSDQAGSLVADFPPINIRPEKHTGYAVQWFFMAVALFILMISSQSNVSEFFRSNNKKIKNIGELNV